MSTKSLLVEDSTKHVFGQGLLRHAYPKPRDGTDDILYMINRTRLQQFKCGPGLAGSTYFRCLMSESRPVEMEMGHNTAIQRPPMNPDHYPAFLQSDSTQSTNVPHHLSRNFVHQQNSETVVGTGSQFWDHPMGSYTVREDESPTSNAPAFPPARQFRSVDEYCLLRQTQF